MLCEATSALAPAAARREYACAGACAAWRCLGRVRDTAAHCCALLPLPRDRPPHADRWARQHPFHKEGVQCSWQLLWCVLPLCLALLLRLKPFVRPGQTDRRCACIGLLTLMACAAWCCCPRLGIQLLLQEELVPGAGPPPRASC